MRKKLLFLLAIVTLAFVGCSDDDDYKKGDIRIGSKNETNQAFYADQLRGTVYIEADGNWTSSINETTSGSTRAVPSWVSISPSNGGATSGLTVTIILDANATGKERSAVITFSCNNDKQEVHINQRSVNEDGTTPPLVVPADVSLVNKATIVYNGGNKREWTFSYDENRRISKAIYKHISSNSTDQNTYDFTYLGSSVNVVVDSRYVYSRATGNNVSKLSNKHSEGYVERPLTRAEGDYNTYEITLQLNSAGYIASATALDIEHYGGNVDTVNYNWNVDYNSNGYIQKASFVWHGYRETENWTYDYTWTGGNLTRVVETGEGENGNDWTDISNVTYHDKYVNNEKINLDLNWLIYHSYVLYPSEGVYDWSMLAFTGLYGKRSTNMVATETDEDAEDDYSYEYELDSNGRISKVTIKSNYADENGTMTIEYK